MAYMNRTSVLKMVLVTSISNIDYNYILCRLETSPFSYLNEMLIDWSKKCCLNKSKQKINSYCLIFVNSFNHCFV